MIGWRNIPGAQSAANFVGTQVANATARTAATKSTTAATAIAHVGKGAEVVSSVAGGTLVVVDKGVSFGAKLAGIGAATTIAAPTALAVTAAYATGAIAASTGVLALVAGVAGAFYLGRFVARRVADAMLTSRIEMVRDSADVVGGICNEGTTAAANAAQIVRE